jgi:citrate lyase subunit beta/citryl-CoA lyase
MPWTQIAALDDARKEYDIEREIPVHVLIETPGALHEVWQIAALPHVESIDFGLMDFVSAHHGAIPGSAMRSPGQFAHALIARAKCEIAAAALGNGVIPAHNVTTELNDPDVVARRCAPRAQRIRLPAHVEHPSAPDPADRRCNAADYRRSDGSRGHPAHRAERATGDRFPGRASCTTALPTATSGNCCGRAHATGAALPAEARHRFFNPAATLAPRCPLIPTRGRHHA